MPHPHDMQAEVVRPGHLDPATIDAWRALEDHAVDPNAYLSPDFVVPALRYLTPERDVTIVVVRSGGCGDALAAAGVFERIPSSLRHPLAAATGYLSPHSFAGGLLLHRDVAPAAAVALLEALRDGAPGVHALELTSCGLHLSAETELGRALSHAGFRWFEAWTKERSLLVPAECGPDCLDELLGKRQRKSVRRNERKLAELGELEWRFVGGKQVGEEQIRRFLELEHMGWKGEEGTSLLSTPEGTRFFEEMTRAFAERGGAYFTEVLLDGEVISSTSNLISGRAGFAFKVGWDPAYKKMGPGTLNEVYTLTGAREHLSDLDFVDSGADPGSYIDDLWRGRRRLTTGTLTLTPLARVTHASLDLARRLKRRAGSTQAPVED